MQRKLRFATSRLFTMRLRDDVYREQFSESSGWTAQSPIVPCESWTLFGEVRAIALPALQDSEAAVAAIPVLFLNEEDKTELPQIVVVSMGIHDGPLSEGAMELNAINPDVTMAQVCETLSPNKKWDVALLAEEAKGRFAGLY
ncbi:hypothetical protein A5N71_01175 [Prescottella equi]|nr:hypothetical protein A5N71_01175 [Prescottella equi]